MEEIRIQINDGVIINADVSVKNVIYVEKNYIWNPATSNCKNGKQLASIMDDSRIMCDEIIESYNDETSTNEKKSTCKM